MRNVETLQQADETTVEYTWQGKTVEISMNNWILTEQGFFLWEDLDEKVLQVIDKLFNIQLLIELESCLPSNVATVP